MAKITICDGCPEKGFDPKTAPKGTLMFYGDHLVVRTDLKWGDSGCLVSVGTGSAWNGTLYDCTPATGKYLLENE